MSFFESASIFFLFLNGILVPITLYYVTAGKTAREAGFTQVGKRLDHLDECLDDLKLKVVGTGITRAEADMKILDLRKEMQDELSKQVAGRHELATRTQLLVDSVEERLTRRIERIEPTIIRPGGASIGA